MNNIELHSIIDKAWEEREKISPKTTGDVRSAIETALDGLDSGEYRVAHNSEGKWLVEH